MMTPPTSLPPRWLGDEGEELEVVVELVMLEEGLSLMVNGIQIRQDRDSLERALLSAFREQLEL